MDSPSYARGMGSWPPTNFFDACAVLPDQGLRCNEFLFRSFTARLVLSMGLVPEFRPNFE